MNDYGKVNWCKLTGQWYQKFFRGKADKITITYHFGGKTKPSSQVIELKSPITKRYCGLKLIEKDLRDIKLYLKEYKKLLGRGNEKSTPNNTSFESLIAKSLLTTIGIHYARCFPGSKGRGALLQESEISNNNIETHRLLMDLRNTYLAHSDVSRYEGCSYVILIPPKNKAYKNTSIPVSLAELFQLTGIDGLGNDIERLIHELYEKVNIKLTDCEENINNIISKLSPEKVYDF